MTRSTLDFHTAWLPLLVACSVFACQDERLRELGYTSNPVTANDPDALETEPAPCEGTLIGADTLIDAVAADLAAAPAESRPYLRYLSFANRVAAGTCPDQLDRERQGVTRLLNSVSRAPAPAAPRVGGPLDSLIAVDLRDYALTDPVDVDGRLYDDGWEALLGESPFDVELTGAAADEISAATGTRVPLIPADALLLAASEAPLYYALLGVPATLGELRASVGLPSALDPAANGALRTGVARSRILRTNGEFRVIDRYSIGSGSAGTYWEAAKLDVGVFLADPLRVQPEVQRLIMYSLPNDLFAFAIYDAAGQRRAGAELVLDTNRDDFTAHVIDSCANCHAQGVLPALDDAGQAILSHPDQFEPEVVSAYADAPSDSERQLLFASDSEPYLEALASVGVSPQGGDPLVLRLFAARFPASLDSAAADLLVTPEQLEARLGELPPELRPLGVELEVSPARFAEHYRAAYCVLHAGDANPPAAAACAP